SCPTDKIQRVKRGQSGPDVIQHVQENGHVCGAPIVWERKNTQGRFNDREWMPKAAKDLSEHGGAFLVIVANKLPGKSELHTKQGSIIVTTPENVAVVACLLRRILIATHGRAAQGVAATVKLRRFFTSGMFSRAIDSVNRELAVWDRTRKERAQKHEKWMAEESGARTRIAHLLVSTSAEIDSILSSDEEAEDRDVG